VPRVLVINWQDWTHPLAGGAEVHLREVFSRLARRGWEVTLLVSAFGGAAKRETMDGMRVVRVGSRDWFNFAVPLAYRRLSAECHFDIVVDDLNKIPFYTPVFAGKPVAALVHHFFERSIFRETWLLPALYVYLAERFVAPVYRRSWFGAVSASTKQDLVRRGIPEARIRLVPNGVDCERYTPDEAGRAERPTVGYFGRLKRYKSVDHLIRAFRLILQEVPDAELLIVGEGDDRSRLERLSAQTGVRQHVAFTGKVTEEGKIRLLRRMWVCVNPSPKEGWGLTVTEANACGTPVVAADSPGLRDSVVAGVTGLLYPYGDLEALSRNVVRILRDGDLRRAMGQAAVEWARQHSWERAADCAEELLLSALQERE